VGVANRRGPRDPAAADDFWMRHALGLAELAAKRDEVPVGAVLVRRRKLIAEGYNRPLKDHDPTAHAEIIAIRAAAARLNNYRLPEATLYVTLEPCPMCVGAIIHARLQRLVFAAHDPRTGAVESVFELLQASAHNHFVAVTAGVLAADSRRLLQDFFRQRRAPQR